MKKRLIYIVISLMALSSCGKSFDVPYTSVVSGSDIADMLAEDPTVIDSYVQGLYTSMITNITYSGHDAFGVMANGMCTDFMCMDIVLDGTPNWGMFDYTQQYGGANYVRAFQMWATYYTLINACNEIIDFFQPGQVIEDMTLRGSLGQAYAVRGMCYMYLMLFFQDPVDENGEFRTDAPGVPIVYASRDGISPDDAFERQGRVPFNIIMEHIEYNFAEAEQYLKGFERPTKIMVDYSVCKGFEARYFLFTQQWEKAAAAAKAAREGYDLMDQARLLEGFMEISDKEVMWGFDHTTETQTVYASFFSQMSCDSPGYAGLNQMRKCIDKSLYDRIQNSDYRKKLFNGPSGDSSAEQAGAKFPYAARKFGFKEQWLQDYIYMRAAEMYLIEAEGHFRSGNSAEATNALKALMSSRNPVWNSSVTLDEILLQRRIELWGEGFSYFDLRRNGLGFDRNYEGSNHPAFARYSIEPHSKLMWFQIPQSEIDNNKFISESDQNEFIEREIEVPEE